MRIFINFWKALMRHKHQSSQKCITLSLFVALFNKLRGQCEKNIASSDDTLSPIAQKMLEKLDKYKNHVDCNMAKLARYLDPRFKNDFIRDKEILSRYIRLLPGTGNDGADPVLAGSTNRSILDECLDNCSIDGFQDEEVTRFIACTSSADRSIEPLVGWQANEEISLPFKSSLETSYLCSCLR